MNMATRLRPELAGARGETGLASSSSSARHDLLQIHRRRRMWNWMSGPESTGRDLQNAAICAARQGQQPPALRDVFDRLTHERMPRVSSFTEIVPASPVTASISRSGPAVFAHRRQDRRSTGMPCFCSSSPADAGKLQQLRRIHCAARQITSLFARAMRVWPSGEIRCRRRACFRTGSSKASAPCFHLKIGAFPSPGR